MSSDEKGPASWALACVLGLGLAGMACGAGSSSGSADAGRVDLGGDVRAAKDSAPKLDWTICDTKDWPVGYAKPSGSVKCSTVFVPADHDRPEGGEVALRVARDGDGSKAALFYLAGGPGGTSVGTSGVLPTMLSGIGSHLDLVYVDQRGTGGSNPLSCPKANPQTVDGWAECGAANKDKGLENFSTIVAARDVEAVRRRLGYEKIYLLGVSYGTTVALEYLRQRSEHVEGVVLDGVAPPELDIMGQSSARFTLSVAKLLDDCSKDTTCRAVSPNLGDELVARRAALKTSPRPIEVGGAAYAEDEELFLQVLNACLSYVQIRSKVPRAIHQASLGNNGPWNALMSALIGQKVTDAESSPTPRPRPLRPGALRLSRGAYLAATEYVNEALFMTILCSEWLPRAGGEAPLVAAMDAQPWPIDNYVFYARACAGWKVTAISSSFHSAVKSDVPTLLLSGELDNRTFPAWGDLAAKHLSGSTHLVMPHLGHATINHSCPASIATAFLKAGGKMEQVDTSCMTSIAPPSW